MAPLRKDALFGIVERSFRQGGWNVIGLTTERAHPRDFILLNDEKRMQLRVYIWNITHGGGAARANDEYRIQITGIPNLAGAQEFQPGSEGKTLILGWWEEVGVFAGFDISHHRGALGSSPSLQIRKTALSGASRRGFSFSEKNNGEIAVAIRPELLGQYAENLEELHNLGEVPNGLNLLEKIVREPMAISDEDIRRQAPGPREYALVTTKKALRDANFRRRVLAAYENKCAMCGVQLELLDAAHILPAAHPESSDEVKNGLSLCALHHRAYDRSLVSFTPDGDEYKTLINEKKLIEFKAANLDGGKDWFVDSTLPFLLLPPNLADGPDPKYVAKANDVRGW